MYLPIGYTVQIARDAPLDSEADEVRIGDVKHRITPWKSVGDFGRDEQKDAHEAAAKHRDVDGWPVVRVVCRERKQKDSREQGPALRSVTEQIMRRIAPMPSKVKRRRAHR